VSRPLHSANDRAGTVEHSSAPPLPFVKSFLAAYVDVDSGSFGVPGSIGEGFGDDEVCGDLHGLRRAFVEIYFHGNGERPASAEIAASRPLSVRTAGWMPRIRSRISARASLASSCASPTSSTTDSTASNHLLGLTFVSVMRVGLGTLAANEASQNLRGRDNPTFVDRGFVRAANLNITANPRRVAPLSFDNRASSSGSKVHRWICSSSVRLRAMIPQQGSSPLAQPAR
jgi:hypothetical protein